MKCKVTDKKIKMFMTFGKMPIANGFLKSSEFTKEFFFEMEVGFNEETTNLYKLYLMIQLKQLVCF